MRALERDVQDAVWQTIEPLLPPPPSHPLRCHRPRVPDRLCFHGILIRLTTGSSWQDIESILDFKASDTTLRARRDEWITAGVFDQIHAEAIAAFDRIIGLDLSEVSIDGSVHKAPYGDEGTGKNPTDRANSAGSGRSESTVTACHSAGRSTERTATTSNSSARPSTRYTPPDSSMTWTRCTSIAATTTRRSEPNSTLPGSRTRSSSAAVGLAKNTYRCRCDSGCAGSSRPPTHGCRTTANSAATPTGDSATDTPRSASRSPS